MIRATCALSRAHGTPPYNRALADPAEHRSPPFEGHGDLRRQMNPSPLTHDEADKQHHLEHQDLEDDPAGSDWVRKRSLRAQVVERHGAKSARRAGFRQVSRPGHQSASRPRDVSSRRLRSARASTTRPRSTPAPTVHASSVQRRQCRDPSFVSSEDAASAPWHVTADSRRLASQRARTASWATDVMRPVQGPDSVVAWHPKPQAEARCGGRHIPKRASAALRTLEKR